MPFLRLLTCSQCSRLKGQGQDQIRYAPKIEILCDNIDKDEYKAVRREGNRKVQNTIS